MEILGKEWIKSEGGKEECQDAKETFAIHAGRSSLQKAKYIHFYDVMRKDSLIAKGARKKGNFVIELTLSFQVLTALILLRTIETFFFLSSLVI